MSAVSSKAPPGLVGIQRAAFDRAERTQSLIGTLQWVLAVLTGAAIFAHGPNVAYVLAVIAVIVTAAILWLEQRGGAMRSLGERVRRITLIAAGLGRPPSADEEIELRLAAAEFEDEAQARDDENYFATQTNPGAARLGAMMEESAFWTHHLLRASQVRSWWRVGALTAVAFIALLTALPLVAAGDLVAVGRLICAVMLLIMSRDVLGAALAYGRAANAVHDVLRRLQRCAAECWPDDQLVHLFGDYNAAVESAPLPRPGLYAKVKDRINGLWAAHKSGSAQIAARSESSA